MKGQERERTLAREDYYTENYFSYNQLWSFIEQIYHIKQFQPQSVIEIGVGNGFVSEFLKRMGIKVKTFDINPNLMPDIVAPLQDIGNYVKPNEFNLISCCEVLEHLPFEEFESSIRKFSNLSNNLFLSLPNHGRYYGFGGLVKLPKFSRWMGIWFRFPLGKSRLPDMHFWEVDYNQQTSKKQIINLLAKYYRRVDTGHFKANPYHCFFKCIDSKNLQ